MIKVLFTDLSNIAKVPTTAACSVPGFHMHHVPVKVCGLGVGKGGGDEPQLSFQPNECLPAQLSWQSVVSCFWHGPHNSFPYLRAREGQEKCAPLKETHLMHRTHEAAEMLVDYSLQLIQVY